MTAAIKPRKLALILDLNNPAFLRTNSPQANYLAVVAWVEYHAMPYSNAYYGIDEWLIKTLEAHDVVLDVVKDPLLLNTALEGYYEFDRLMAQYIQHSPYDISYAHTDDASTVITIIYYGVY